MRVARDLQDINADEVLAQLDADTRAYLQVLLNAGGQAFTDENETVTVDETETETENVEVETTQTASQDLRETLKRFEPLSRNGRRITNQLAKRRSNLKRVIHNFQLLSTELARKDSHSLRWSTRPTPTSRRWPPKRPACAGRSNSSRRH